MYNMYQKDYILRMIEMLGDFLRAIFGMLSEKDYQKASEKINEAYFAKMLLSLKKFRLTS